ncbi:MAG: hypothetical protein A2Y23_06090 [Clostridiales bacterium GWB2_37_7]|nr:MAG: hypothetical protein A2Y23_06090 [Clostridiales bacterium GWB2_37_7]
MQDWLILLLKTIGLYFLTFIIIRLMGKSNPLKMTPFKFINYIIIAMFVVLITLNIIENWAFGMLALGVWVAFTIALDYLSIKSKQIHDIVNGKSTILIDKGKIMEENMQQSRMTGEELLSALRSKNAFSFGDVEFAVMESTGDINVLLKADKKPVTAHDLGNQVAPQSQPQTVILDGNVLDEPLSNMGLNRDWLYMQLENIGVSLENNFIGQADSSGDLFVDLFDDSLQVPMPRVKEMLFANLEKTHADLLSFALETDSNEAKNMYSKNATKLDEVVQKLKPYLLH